MAELTKRYSRILFQKDQTNLVSEAFYVGNHKVVVSAYSGGSGLPPGARITFEEVVFIDGGRTDGTICTPGYMNNSQQYDYKPYAACGCEPALSERMSCIEFDRPGWYRAVYKGPSRASVMLSAIETSQEAKSSNCSVPCCPIDVDLVIDKAVSSKVITAGAPGSFTLTVTNKGPEASVGGSVMDQLPTGLTYGTPVAVYTGGATGSQPSLAELPAGDWHYTLLPVGGKIVITIPFVADGPGSFVPDNNQATVLPGPKERETNYGNNTDNVFFVVVKPTGDVWITKSIAADELKEGDTFVYTVTTGNTGPDAAGGSIIKDDIPNGLVVSSISVAYSGGAAGPQPTEAQLAAGYIVPTLPAGGQVVITVTGTAPKAGYYLNSASIRAPSGVSDSDPGNNTATAPLTVVGKTVDLSITKTANKETYNIGEAVVYTINFANAGASDANGAVVKDVLSTTLNSIAITTTFTAGAGTGTPTQAQLAAGWVIPTLPAGGSGVITVTGITTVAGIISNQASIVAPTGRTDTNPGNNNAIAVITVAQPAKTDVCGNAIDDTVDKYVVAGNLKGCDNQPLPCKPKLKQCCDEEVIVGYPTGLFDLTGCIIGATIQTDSYRRLVWRSRDDTTIASRGISSNGAPNYIKFEVTNPFDCDALVEVSMQAHTESINSQIDGTQEITYIHKVGEVLNVDPYPYGSAQWAADSDGWSFSTNSFNSDAGGTLAGSAPPTFPTLGGTSSQTTPPARLFRNIAAGQTLTFYAQFWIVISDTIAGDAFSLHAGFTKNSYWKITRGGKVV